MFNSVIKEHNFKWVYYENLDDFSPKHHCLIYLGPAFWFGSPRGCPSPGSAQHKGARGSCCRWGGAEVASFRATVCIWQFMSCEMMISVSELLAKQQENLCIYQACFKYVFWCRSPLASIKSNLFLCSLYEALPELQPHDIPQTSKHHFRRTKSM